MIIALGVTWILDRLEVTLVRSIAGALTEKDTLGLTISQATAAGSFYLAGLPDRERDLPDGDARDGDRPFYACGTGVAIAAPWTFGKLIETGSAGEVVIAFVIGGTIIIIGGIVEILLGVEAAKKSLEAVARPINAVRTRVHPQPRVASARAQEALSGCGSARLWPRASAACRGSRRPQREQRASLRAGRARRRPRVRSRA